MNPSPARWFLFPGTRAALRYQQQLLNELITLRRNNSNSTQESWD
jgi:hypothetical protein